MTSWIAVASGFATFLVAHLVEFARWTAWFGGRYPPWFLNSGRAVLFTTACLFIVSAVIARGAVRPFAAGLATATGAAAAMVVVLFAGGHPGTIFPIVLAIGAATIGAATFAGALVGTALRAR